MSDAEGRSPVGPSRRVLLVGCGGVAFAWLEPLLRRQAEVGDVELVGLVDPRRPAAEALAARYHLGVPVADEVERAMADTAADLLLDATPPDAHELVARVAARAGADVVAEKPAATSLGALARLTAIVASGSIRYVVMQNRRYYPGFRSLVAAVHSGRLGRLRSVEIDFSRRLRAGGFRAEMAQPMLFDLAIHHFDSLRVLLGRDPQEVVAVGSNPSDSGYRGPIGVWATLTVGEGADALVVGYRAMGLAGGRPTSFNGRWRVVGADTVASWDGTSADVLVDVERPEMPEWSEGRWASVVAPPGPPLRCPDAVGPLGDYHGAGLWEALDALASGEPAPTELADHRRSLIAVLATARALDERRPVSLDEVAAELGVRGPEGGWV